MDAFPGCFCKSVVGKMISTGSGPNHPTCVIPRYRSTGRRQVSASDRSEIIAAAQVGLRRLSLRPSEPPVRPHNIFAGFGPLMRIPTFRQALAMKRPEQSGSGQTASGRFANLLLDDRIERIRSPGRMSSITSTPSITRPKQVCTPSKCCVFSRFMQIKNCEPPVSLPRWAIESTPRSWYCRPADVSQGMVYPGPPVPSPRGSRPE